MLSLEIVKQSQTVNLVWLLLVPGLNGNLTITELKKPQPSRLVGKSEMWNRLVLHPCVMDKNLGGMFQE